MRLTILGVFLAVILAGCSGGKTRPPAATASTPATSAVRNAARDLPSVAAALPPISKQGLEAVIGKDSAALIRLFGEPRLNVQEVNGRKLQFVGTACVLDAYLYPDGTGGAEIATHVDARRRDGAEVDRAACVNALIKR